MVTNKNQKEFLLKAKQETAIQARIELDRLGLSVAGIGKLALTSENGLT